jgi:hypothetical protein
MRRGISTLNKRLQTVLFRVKIVWTRSKACDSIGDNLLTFYRGLIAFDYPENYLS